MTVKKQNESILIRKATAKDIEDILRLNSALFKEEYKKYDNNLNLKWTYSSGRKYFKNRIVKRNSFVEVAEAKGKIIGYLCGDISRGKSYHKKAKYAELENMMIKNELRRKGIGTMLMRSFLNWCKKNKVKHVTVAASAKNKQAISFYRKVGFKDYGLILEHSSN